jgi:hypothetical protein
VPLFRGRLFSRRLNDKLRAGANHLHLDKEWIWPGVLYLAPHASGKKYALDRRLAGASLSIFA